MSTGVQPNANIQTISFRRPTNKPAESTAKPKNRHGGLLQDQLRRCVLVLLMGSVTNA